MMKQLKLVLIFLVSIIQLACSPENVRVEMPLEKYGYQRTEFKSSDLEYLLGNAEMGALSNNKGLGFTKLWFTDVWENKEWRQSLPGPLLSNPIYEKKDYAAAEFTHDLNIKNGIQTTRVKFKDGKGYETKIFFSKSNKHLLVINIKNISSDESIDNWDLALPFKGFKIIKEDENLVTAKTSDENIYTKSAWALKSEKPVKYFSNKISFNLAPNESNTILYSVTTNWDGKDFIDQANKSVDHSKSISAFVAEQNSAWEKQWKSIASVILPEGEYAKWFYRSIALLYWTTGAEHFCAGEKQFSIPDVDWHMHPFTYGHGGSWAVWAFASFGDLEHAENIARWHYKPEALKENVKILFPKLGKVKLTYRGEKKGTHTYFDEYNPNAIAFGHEVNTEGHNITYTSDKHWDLQRHVDGHAAAFYHLIERYFPDEKRINERTYPVLKGTAELYSSLLKWDEKNKIYFLPPLLSVAENIMEKSVLDAVLAAKWTLNTAADYADKLNVDEELKNKWKDLSSKIYIPQNETTYLEYLNDTQTREGGGYFGIRAFEYFGFPFAEQIKNLDKEKMRRALDYSWSKNNKGEGMISFILNWFALTESFLGYGENAYRMSKQTTEMQDSSGTCLVEVITKNDDGTESRINKYFLTGNDALLLVPITMMLQSYDNQISVFPSMPEELKNVSFYDLQAEGGIKVSAEMKDGKFKWAEFKKEGKKILRLKENKKVEIVKEGKEISLKTLEQNL